MKKLLFAVYIILSVYLKAQDTVIVMTYNLLNFGNTTSYCTSTNNNFNAKKGYLKTIVNYVLPDIFGVNEVAANNSVIQLIVDSILNTNGVKTYSRIQYINSSNSDIVNTIFYNNQKFKFYSTNYLQTDLRDVIILNLYYNGKEVETQNDTVFLRIMQVHLKAGNTTSDQARRLQETTVIMNYMNSLGNSKNTILMGDLNVSSSTEECFQKLINYPNPSVRFFDPINKLGTWHDNSDFALYHTQSAQLNSNGCTSGGGLDDRFDFILVSFGIMNNLYKVSYVSNSYKVIGQDGNHFNLGVDNPENYSVPNDVLLALSKMSDHLPVVLKLKIDQTPLIGFHNPDIQIFDINLVYSNQHQLYFTSNERIYGSISIQISDVLGNIIFERLININNETSFYVSIPDLLSGMYLVKLSYNNKSVVKKIIIY